MRGVVFESTSDGKKSAGDAEKAIDELEPWVRCVLLLIAAAARPLPPAELQRPRTPWLRLQRARGNKRWRSRHSQGSPATCFCSHVAGPSNPAMAGRGIIDR
eukprot:gene2017-biopygen2526